MLSFASVAMVASTVLCMGQGMAALHDITQLTCSKRQG